jgi:hypothetical protein
MDAQMVVVQLRTHRGWARRGRQAACERSSEVHISVGQVGKRTEVVVRMTGRLVHATRPTLQGDGWASGGGQEQAGVHWPMKLA